MCGFCPNHNCLSVCLFCRFLPYCTASFAVSRRHVPITAACANICTVRAPALARCSSGAHQLWCSPDHQPVCTLYIDSDGVYRGCSLHGTGLAARHDLSVWQISCRDATRNLPSVTINAEKRGFATWCLVLLCHVARSSCGATGMVADMLRIQVWSSGDAHGGHRPHRLPAH